ncbi:hypothetical protein TWF481_010797 [Arthrobotrys musiformis]|uniref:Cytochrome P450 n=1 Tax=Arthrobotrys musiformis TaxID=47236 RepID=A0AAV9W4K2_9PEZI
MVLADILDGGIPFQGYLIGSTILLFVYLIVDALYQLYFSPLANIPGPWYAAISGIWYISKLLRGQSMFAIHDLHERYGPYVRVSPNDIMISDAEAVKKIHSTFDVFPKSDVYKKAGLIQKSIAIMVDHDEVKKRRKAIGNGFSNSHMRSLELVICGKVDLCVKKIKQDLEAKGVADILPWFGFLSTDTIGQIAFGKDFKMLANGMEGHTFGRDLMLASGVMFVRGHIPGGKYLESLVSSIPHPTIKWVFESGQRVFTYTNQAIRDLQKGTTEDQDASSKSSVFSSILQNQNDPAAKYKMTAEEMRDEALGFVLAGTDTLTITGTYLIWAILRHKEVRRKMEAELNTFTGDNITDEALQQLPYFKCVMKEVLRLYTGAQIGLPRTVPRGGRQLGPYFLPGGTGVMTPIYSIHRDPTIFEEPLLFRPGRWLSATKDMEAAILAFGGASRICVGQNLAKMILRLLAATILKQLPDVGLADSCTDESMEFAPRLFVAAKGGKCELQNRRE